MSGKKNIWNLFLSLLFELYRKKEIEGLLKGLKKSLIGLEIGGINFWIV